VRTENKQTNKQGQVKDKNLEKKWEYSNLINESQRQVEAIIRNYGVIGVLISQGVNFERADHVHETWYEHCESGGQLKALLFNFLY
jgi:hypothetical protein